MELYHYEKAGTKIAEAYWERKDQDSNPFYIRYEGINF